MELRKITMANEGKRPVSISGKRNRYVGSGGATEPKVLLNQVQFLRFLGKLTNSIVESVIVQWKEAWRRDCLQDCIARYRTKCALKATRAWMDQWMQRIIILKGRTESPFLDSLTDMCQLGDMLDLVPHPDDYLEWEPSKHFTGNSFSVSSGLPAGHLAYLSGKRGRHRLPGKVAYPIRGANSDGTVAELIDCLTESGTTELSTALTWDQGFRRVR
ncbi:unnamed protein product [Peronospora belbahrii]|uniref:Uncharacterized protein n=1 Tax=Peronospora belbahrii TaxID=622444 RepID=A0ABN8D551_9STRA|nr:unnamed protein product [Peronospora belbahrii]